MIIRRSRLIVVVVLLIALHTLFVLYISDVDVYDIADQLGATGVIYGGIEALRGFKSVKKLVNRSFEENYLIPYKEHRLSDPEDKEYMYLLDKENRDDKNSILIPKIYKQESQAPPVINYDPRLALGLILNHLTASLQEDGGSGTSDLRNLQIPFFHWSDYANLTRLNDHILNPVKQRCQSLKVTTNNGLADKNQEILYPENFCVDDDSIDDKLSEENSGMTDDTKERLKLIQSKFETSGSTGFHVHRYPGRSSKDFKILEGKSFLNDFMDTPYAIVLLLPSEPNEYGGPNQLSSALKINVNQGTNGFRKLIHSNMFRRYYESQNIQAEDDQDVNIDVKQLLDQFLGVLKNNVQYQQHLSKNSDIPYEKTLTPDLFIDNATEILQQYKERETNQELSPQEASYMHGLDMASNSPYPLKYFYEAKLTKKEPNWALGGHYDWRFFNGLFNSSKYQSSVLYQLISAWFKLINNYHLNSWIAHGTLLSWYWNALTFPWDVDLDVQMPIQDLHALCRDFNQTIVFDLGHENNNEIRFTRGFLDCGTFIGTRQNSNGHNNIDARFVDMDTGLYIDITGLALTEVKPPTRYNIELPQELRPGATDETISNKMRNEYLQIYNCKNNHFTKLSDLSPLRLSKFEGQYNYVPNNFKQLLVNEYKVESINTRKFRIFSFIQKLNLWVSSKDIISFVKKKYPETSKALKVYRANNIMGKNNPDRVIDEEFKSDDDYVEYLLNDKGLLFEFLLTNELTGFHASEMDKLNQEKSTEKLFYKSGKLKDHSSNLRHDYFNLMTYLTGYNFKTDNEGLLKRVDQFKNGEIPEGQAEQPQEQKEEPQQPQQPPDIRPGPQPQVQAQSESPGVINDDSPSGVKLPKIKPGEMSSLPGLVKQGEKHLGDKELTRPDLEST